MARFIAGADITGESPGPNELRELGLYSCALATASDCQPISDSYFGSLGLVYNTYAAAAEILEDTVMGKGFADR